MRGMTLDKGLMVDEMTSKKFLKDETGVVAVEYVIFVAAVGIILAVGGLDSCSAPCESLFGHLGHLFRRLTDLAKDG